MDTDIAKYLLLYLCMSLAVSFFFPQTILGNGETNILGIFKVNVNSTNGEIYINETGWANSDLNVQQSGDETQEGWFKKGIQAVSSIFQWVVDGLGNILGTLKVLVKFTFSPFIFVLNPDLMGGAPFFVKLIFAIPLVFIMLMATVKFIRGMP